MARSAQHLNNNILCAVDVETTGLNPGFNEIWQICVLPLDSACKPSREIPPFYQDIKINYPDRISRKAVHISRERFAEKQIRALDAFTAADMMDEWFQRLNLPLYKKIVPLAHNWPFDRHFILDWLGPASFNDFFHPHYRDSMTAAIFLMDLADHNSRRVEMSKFNLSELCNKMDVTNLQAHDALQDCVATAECYRRLMSWAS